PRGGAGRLVRVSETPTVLVAGPGQRGPLRPIELAVGAVLGGVTVGLITVGSVVPFAAALQLVAAVPMGMLAHRYRVRALVTATVAAALVTFVAAGVMPAIGVVSTAAIGGIIGGVKRHGRGLATACLAASVAGLAWAAFSVGSLLVFAKTRELFFDTVRNTAGGVREITESRPELESIGRAVDSATEAVLTWWWLYVGSGVVVGVLVS